MDFEQFKYVLKAGLLFGGLAAAIFLADSMRKKNGLGWIDFFSRSGKFVKQGFVLVPKFKQGFNIISAIALVAGGLIVWIAYEILTPEKEVSRGPLDMAPPSAAENSDSVSDTSKLTIKDFAPQ